MFIFNLSSSSSHSCRCCRLILYPPLRLASSLLVFWTRILVSLPLGLLSLVIIVNILSIFGNHDLVSVPENLMFVYLTGHISFLFFSSLDFVCLASCSLDLCTRCIFIRNHKFYFGLNSNCDVML